MNIALALALNLVIDHNIGAAATPKFQFEHVASPAKTAAKVAVIAGTPDRGSADVTALIDGLTPTIEDEPGANLFFAANSWGGRIRFDLDEIKDVTEIRSYSWHPDSRAPQVYYVYGSDGTSPSFDPAPGAKKDLASCGWRQIAFVDTHPKSGDAGGQYAVSITDTTGSLGRYRYLLLDVFETESEDVWGNTFYSEITVVTK
ncbi:MAG TPA: hypothetical protein VHU41_11930 [Thermoanaerobaculia bacterium]|jgi:hypothetical protein|nr:hypothetical protein [Thermoanaerobaculia bacterium]